MDAVEKNISSQRPTWRVSAAKVDTLVKHALLISDHSRFARGMFLNYPATENLYDIYINWI